MAADPHSTRLLRCPNCDAPFKVSSSSRSRSAGRFKRPTASSAVITKLVELGYLQPKARHRAGAIEKAIGRLRSNLIRDGIVLRR
jgi:hypothetical protein